MNASWPQTKTIWSICIKVKVSNYGGPATDPQFWRKLADEGKLTRDAASRIISAFIEKASFRFHEAVKTFDPDFPLDDSKFRTAKRWTPRKTYPKPQPDPIPEADDEPREEEEKAEGADDEFKTDALVKTDDKEPEDEFERKLKELEEAHRRSKEAAAKKRAMEKFKPESIEYVKPAIFDDVCAMIKGGVQVCLVGPSGCGKSLLINEVAKVLGRGLYMESFAGGKRYSQIFGSTHLVDGKSEWVAAKFMSELQVENNIVFMDEVMSADPDVLIGANPILDRKTRCFHSPIGVINVNPTCTICAASNVTGREYSMNYKGTQQQDASILNRFVHIHMTYDNHVELTILKNSPLDSADMSYLSTKIDSLRRTISTNNISYDPSTRKLVQAIELIALGLPKEKAFEYAFLTPLSDVERKKICM